MPSYAPHRLFVKRVTEARDDYNRVSKTEASWEFVVECRCDDNTVRIVSTENSLEYVPRYHIVTARTDAIANGDIVRVLNADGTLRGEGKADAVRVLNYLNYTDLYAGV